MSRPSGIRRFGGVGDAKTLRLGAGSSLGRRQCEIGERGHPMLRSYASRGALGTAKSGPDWQYSAKDGRQNVFYGGWR